MSNVPVWAWAVLAILAVAVLTGAVLAMFEYARRRAPRDTELWDGGEPGRREHEHDFRPDWIDTDDRRCYCGVREGEVTVR